MEYHVWVDVYILCECAKQWFVFPQGNGFFFFSGKTAQAENRSEPRDREGLCHRDLI